MIRKVSIFVVLVLWIALPGAIAIRSLESVPASDGGVLTAGVGQQISLTCSHDNDASAITFWRISAPINCNSSFTHPGAGSTQVCGPFSFVNVSPENTAPYTSTAVANAAISMTGAVVQCLDGAGPAAVQVGSNITLCVYGQVTEISCPDLEISWNAVIDGNTAACTNQVEYMVTITNIGGVVTTRNVSVNRFSGSNILQRGESYNVSVCSKAVNGSCSAEPATILCEISLTPPPPTTSTTSPQGTNVAAIVVSVVVVLLVVAAIVIVIILVVYFFCRPGHNKSCQKSSLSTHVGKGKHKAESTKSNKAKSNKGGADNTEMATYQDPATIQHKQAPSGDLYALTDKLEKREKSKNSEVPTTIQHKPAASGDLYALTGTPKKEDISKESQKKELNYAKLEMSGGSGTPVNPGPPTEYTSVNY